MDLFSAQSFWYLALEYWPVALVMCLGVLVSAGVDFWRECDPKVRTRWETWGYFNGYLLICAAVSLMALYVAGLSGLGPGIESVSDALPSQGYGGNASEAALLGFSGPMLAKILGVCVVPQGLFNLRLKIGGWDREISLYALKRSTLNRALENIKILAEEERDKSVDLLLDFYSWHPKKFVRALQFGTASEKMPPEVKKVFAEALDCASPDGTGMPAVDPGDVFRRHTKLALMIVENFPWRVSRIKRRVKFRLRQGLPGLTAEEAQQLVQKGYTSPSKFLHAAGGHEDRAAISNQTGMDINRIEEIYHSTMAWRQLRRGYRTKILAGMTGLSVAALAAIALLFIAAVGIMDSEADVLDAYIEDHNLDTLPAEAWDGESYEIDEFFEIPPDMAAGDVDETGEISGIPEGE